MLRNYKKVIFLFACLTIVTLKNNAQSIVDYDGNVYSTVTIGSQIWMGENLKVTHYCDGSPIPNVTDNNTWINLTGCARCWYNNDSSTYANTYGSLYNYYTVFCGQLCPLGWIIPSLEDWDTLRNYLGGSLVAGGKLKETGTDHWLSPNTNATNEYNFTALPGGYRNSYFGNFYDINIEARWWNNLPYFDPEISSYCSVNYSYAHSSCGAFEMKNGLSVRCLKDTLLQLNESNYQNMVNIYPNPTKNIIHIDFAKREVLKLQIYNIIGECLLQKTLNNSTNDIDISYFSKGIYLIIIHNSEWTVHRKLTKE